MKTKLAVVLGCLIGAVVLPLGFGYKDSQAGSKADKPSSKIGVVSIRRIFQDCRRNAGYRQEAFAEQSRVIAELERLSKEIETGKAGLKTLKAGSNDHLTLMKEVLEKQAGLQAQQEFHKQQMVLRDQRWTEELYKDILRETGKVAEQKGLDLVFGTDEVELPAPSANELMLTIKTHKLLYSGGCLDITDEVMALLDAEK